MSSPAEIVEWLGDANAAAIVGCGIGLAFGAFAQRSRFCLRSATIEFARRDFGAGVARWALAFSAALLATQSLIAIDWLNVSTARQLASTGSLSGAILGGLMFGVGMIMARGCASRLLVLSATGNLRALIAGLILTITAQTAYRGVLAPLREMLAGLWLVDGPQRNLLLTFGLGPGAGILFGLICLAAAVVIARRVALDRS